MLIRMPPAERKRETKQCTILAISTGAESTSAILTGGYCCGWEWWGWLVSVEEELGWLVRG
jgi:hypothetical protein